MAVLQDKSFEELKEYLVGEGERPFRAEQIFKGLSSGRRISEITDVSKDLRAKLCAAYEDKAIEIIGEKTSVKDGTIKYLFRLSDGNVIEGVLMKYKYGNTQCVSTQVGCRMRCAFCASGIGGLVRNLTAGEILAQVALVNAVNGGTLE
ncbi:MAG: 23S rRNA (adenine(2503)-C(2))-methyltransferase RlmN, partial [Clostridia bacterium]|nr:23S rRNA (adenine(2503)-C(2))-methyltransferase RlmN [Clostridia bacterium]